MTVDRSTTCFTAIVSLHCELWRDNVNVMNIHVYYDNYIAHKIWAFWEFFFSSCWLIFNTIIFLCNWVTWESTMWVNEWIWNDDYFCYVHQKNFYAAALLKSHWIFFFFNDYAMNYFFLHKNTRIRVWSTFNFLFFNIITQLSLKVHWRLAHSTCIHLYNNFMVTQKLVIFFIFTYQHIFHAFFNLS